jgi:hypothetical protein
LFVAKPNVETVTGQTSYTGGSVGQVALSRDGRGPCGFAAWLVEIRICDHFSEGLAIDTLGQSHRAKFASDFCAPHPSMKRILDD